ncbi:MAG TPA: TonB-dependent receptor, partial [Bacteroidia bacterium]|nr:TonB-dependent receptor [Bacteroidia bacterium]
LYVSDDFDVTDRVRLSLGLRESYFIMVGPFDRYVHDVTGKIVDTTHYGTGIPVADYGGPEPRASVRYSINKQISLKANYTHNYQYIHLASLSSVSLPTDVWVPCSDVVKPQISDQIAMGYFQNFHENMFETSVEVYYKKMQHQVEYKEGALPTDDTKDNADNNFVFGSGQSYGAEFFFKKSHGKLTGWVGYTLSWTTRDFPDLNNGQWFYAKYDRRHDVSIVSTYTLSPRWTFSAVWVYGTGNAVTLPVARYFIDGTVVSEYSARNALRMAPYHRLDISATWTLKKTKRLEHSLNFSVFNVYNRMNPYFIYFDSSGSLQQGNLTIQAKQVSLFPILPSVTYNFKW